jgi:aspartate aminotransferase/aminotransferase
LIVSATVSELLEAISIKYNNMVYEIKSSGGDVIVLSLGEAFFDLPKCDFTSLPYPDVYHYSHSRGIPSLREKVCRYYEDHYAVRIDPAEEILITAGSKIGVYYALQTVINPGDEVLIVEPFWVSYSEQVKLIGGVPKYVPLGESVFEFEKYITKRTKCLIVNNPQNPSGKNFTHKEVVFLNEITKKHGIWIIADEAYSDFLREEKFVSFGVVDPSFDNTVIVNSISKNFGISGWRIGYLISNPRIVYSALKLNQHMMTCAPTPLLMFLDKHFDEIIQQTKPQIEDLIIKRKRIQCFMDELGIKAEPGTATFYFLVDISKSKLHSVAFCDRLLAEQFVAVVPGIGYGQTCDRHVRISFGSESDDRVYEGLKRIRNLIDATQ